MTGHIDDLEPFESPLLLIGAAKENIVKVEAFCKLFVETCKGHAV